MTNTLIPGIYTSYELSGVRYTHKNAGTAGLVWKGDTDETSVSAFTSLSQIASVYGTDSTVFALSSVLFANGASCVKSVQIKEDYDSGFALLAAETDVAVTLCDSEDINVHQSMKNSILSCGENSKYRVGVVWKTGDVNTLTAHAKAINCERMVLLPDVYCAAALAGVILGTEDPSLPFNGAVLYGAEAEFNYAETEINSLLQGGVTPIRTVGNECEVVRCVTTKTETEGLSDSTWRDVNTVLTADYVMMQIKANLRTMFTRAKNTERTRGAVRTQTVICLERMLDMGIIESYGNVTAVKSETDPNVCEVNFEFSVAGGMHSIIIAAGLTV